MNHMQRLGIHFFLFYLTKVGFFASHTNHDVLTLVRIPDQQCRRSIIAVGTSCIKMDPRLVQLIHVDGVMVVGAVSLGQFCSTSLRTVFARVLHSGRTVET